MAECFLGESGALSCRPEAETKGRARVVWVQLEHSLAPSTDLTDTSIGNLSGCRTVESTEVAKTGVDAVRSPSMTPV
jgi:hypothetical protein